MRQNARPHQSPARAIAAFPPAFARVVRLRLQSCAVTIHIAFSRKRQHGYQVSATEALPSWPRSPWFAAPGLGAPLWRAPRRGAPLWRARRLTPPKPSCTPRRRSRSVSTPPRRGKSVKSRRLLEPFAALKFAGAQRKAEALSARLCRTGDDFIYEITLLHRDGRLVHVEMEAATGKSLRARRVSRTKLTSPTNSRASQSRIDFRRELG